MQGWTHSPLGEVVHIVNGGTPKTKKAEFWDGDVPWITPKDMGQQSSEYVFDTSRSISNLGLSNSSAKLVPENSVILSTRAPIGHLAINRVPMAFNQGCRGLVPSKKIETRFLYYFLLANVDLLNELGTGTTFKELSKTALSSVQFSYPSLSEQERIVAILDEAFKGIDAAIANTERNLANVKELIESTLNALVLGTSEGSQLPNMNNQNVAELSSEQTARSTDRKFRGPRCVSRDELPTLPDGWSWASPEQLCSHIVDCLHATPKWSDHGEFCLRTTNFRVEGLDLSELRRVSSGTYAKRISRLEPQARDVLYSREGGILGIACMFPNDLKACLGQRMMQFRLRREYMLPEFFCAVLNSKMVLGEVRSLTGGAAAPHLNIGDIRRFPIPVPPMSVQKALVDKIGEQTEGFHQLRETHAMKLRLLSELKQSILQKAFSGELTAADEAA